MTVTDSRHFRTISINRGFSFSPIPVLFFAVKTGLTFNVAFILVAQLIVSNNYLF